MVVVAVDIYICYIMSSYAHFGKDICLKHQYIKKYIVQEWVKQAHVTLE